MTKTKLTLRLDQELIGRAKAYADQSGRSVSSIVADFFALLDASQSDHDVSPIVRDLRGALAGADVRRDGLSRPSGRKVRMRLLVDTNVVLDVLLDRQPFAEPAARLLTAIERGQVGGLLGATTITTVFYLAERARDRTGCAEAHRAPSRLFPRRPCRRGGAPFGDPAGLQGLRRRRVA
jgi:hypothetical protein